MLKWTYFVSKIPYEIEKKDYKIITIILSIGTCASALMTKTEIPVADKPLLAIQISQASYNETANVLYCF